MKFLPCILLSCFVYNIQGRVITNSGLFEGDIVLTESSKQLIDGNVSFDAVISNSRKWPNAVVPYAFHRSFDIRRRQVVQQAIQDYNKYTCIRFVPRTNQRNYVIFVIGGGCSSMIGMQGSSQAISIGHGCQHKGIVIHEMMHALGFWHEQSRLDRDRYITIYWNNIIPGMQYNFRKYSHGQADFYGEPYDYDSVMHYGSRAFSRNGRSVTISAKGNSRRQLGQRRGFSTIDKKQLNKLYKCKGTTGGGKVKPTVKPKPGGSCTDGHRHCYYWSQRGHCTSSHRNWMQKHCRKSCRKCSGGGGGGGGCSDKNRYCSGWARIGYCRWNAYVKKNCRKSCRSC